MIDLARLMNDAAEAMERVNHPDFPLLVGKQDAGGNEQPIENEGVSHLSHFSHPENKGLANLLSSEPGASAGGCARDEGLSKEVGKVGKVGNGSKFKHLHFPPSILKVGKVGNAASAGCHSPTVISWRAAFTDLTPDVMPCRGFREREWPEVVPFV